MTAPLKLFSTTTTTVKPFKFLILSTKNSLKLIRLLEPFPKQQILDFSKLRVFADDYFKLDENDKKISRWVENTGGKGEIARYE